MFWHLWSSAAVTQSCAWVPGSQAWAWLRSCPGDDGCTKLLGGGCEGQPRGSSWGSEEKHWLPEMDWHHWAVVCDK